MLNLNVIRRAAGLALGVIASVSLLCLVFWPDWAEQTLHSRAAVAFFSIWCILLASIVHPTIQRGLQNGFRNFLESCDNIGRDIDFWW